MTTIREIVAEIDGDLLAHGGGVSAEGVVGEVVRRHWPAFRAALLGEGDILPDVEQFTVKDAEGRSVAVTTIHRQHTTTIRMSDRRLDFPARRHECGRYAMSFRFGDGVSTFDTLTLPNRDVEYVFDVRRHPHVAKLMKASDG